MTLYTLTFPNNLIDEIESDASSAQAFADAHFGPSWPHAYARGTRVTSAAEPKGPPAPAAPPPAPLLPDNWRTAG